MHEERFVMIGDKPGRGAGGQLMSVATAAVIALCGGLLPAAQAAAGIVYSGVTHIQAPATTNGLYLNLVTGVFSSSASAVPGWDINIWGASTLSFWANNLGSTTSGVVSGFGVSASQVDNLSMGTSINGTLTYARQGTTETSGPNVFLLNSSDNYIGFRFLNEVSGLTSYGWLQMHIGSSFVDPERHIVGWAYNDSGISIRVGDTGAVQNTVPEPASYALALLALTGCAVARRRCRPSQAAAAAA
jgi:hypothetical protein